jgi:NAD(P)-dependent dehydrogenase (short-subunit alcohol dehydrogenase family)
MSSTNKNAFDLYGKVAVVVGGSGHLCSVLGGALRRAGATAVIADVRPPEESEFPFFRCDVTSKADVLRCRDEVFKRFGRVDVLLNGAGTNAPTPFFEISEEEIARILAVNLVSLVYTCQAFGEVMVRQGSGSIVNFASASSGPPLSRAFIYSMAKAGVVNLTQNLAREWAAAGGRVNALRPGFFPTEWSMRNFIDEDRKAKILGHTPMGRFGQPQELEGAVLWLASDAASFVTGAVIPIDGGFTAMTI